MDLFRVFRAGCCSYFIYNTHWIVRRKNKQTNKKSCLHSSPDADLFAEWWVCEVIKESCWFWLCDHCKSEIGNVPSLLSFRGSSIAKIIGNNVKASNRFDPMVNMWVYEEIIQGRKLTEIINTEHENVKYLPGHKLPKNVVSVQVFPAPADLVLFPCFKWYLGQ